MSSEKKTHLLSLLHLLKSEHLYPRLICSSGWEHPPYWGETFHTCSTRNIRGTSVTGEKSICLKYIEINAYLALNGESDTAFFASIKLSYSFALEEKIFIIIDYCLKCTGYKTSKRVQTLGFSAS